MNKKAIVCLLVLVIIFSLLAVTISGCAKPTNPVDVDHLEVYMGKGHINKFDQGDYYIGTRTFISDDSVEYTNQIDISKLFGPEYRYFIEQVEGEAKLDGSLLTVNDPVNEKTGSWFDIKLVKAEQEPQWYHFHIVKDGYNVFNLAQFAYIVSEQTETLAGGGAVLHTDLKLKKGNEIEMANGKTMDTEEIMVYNDIYGNGHMLDASDVISTPDYKKHWGTSCLDLSYAKEVNLQDFKIVGYHVPEGQPLRMEDMYCYGKLITINSNGESHPKVNIRNVIAENSHQVIYINGADVTLDGCVIRNASDSCISIETNGDGKNNVTLRNCTLANALTAGVTMWGTEKTPDDKFVDLKVEGFLDIYNWKDDSVVKLMPENEPLAGIVNSQISGVLAGKEYQPYFYKQSGKKYIHLGMIIIATNGLKENRAMINGARAIDNKKEKIPSNDNYNSNLEFKDFPLPGVAKGIAHTCLLVTYQTKNIMNLNIKPETKFSDNPTFYEDMYYGRK